MRRTFNAFEVRRGVAGFSALMLSRGTICGYYGGLFLAIVMDYGQLLSIMEKDGTTMVEVIGSC